MKHLITIDTECDNAWAKSKCIETKNSRYLPRFQELCESYDFKPTYLVAYEMANDEFFKEFAKDILKRGTGEIGSHPHPWNSPPDYSLTSNDMRYHPYLIEYPKAVIEQKLKYLTSLLEDTFNVKINSHRAGKWGFDANYARILEEQEYKVDCSVTPYVCWESGLRSVGNPECPVIDYRTFHNEPYFLDSCDIAKSGDMQLLEIPVTIVPRYNALVMSGYRLFSRKFLRRLFKYLFGSPVSWFRPNIQSGELLDIASEMLNSKFDYIMFMLHSSEFMPGGSPYFETERDIENMYEQIEGAFEFLHGNNVQGMTCFEYYQYYLQKS